LSREAVAEIDGPQPFMTCRSRHIYATRALTAAVMALVLGSEAQAASITWGSIQNATGLVSDVVTIGAFVDSATDFYTDLSLNGVTFHRNLGIVSGTVSFDASNITFGNVQVDHAQYGSAPVSWDSSYRDLLAFGAYTNSGSGPIAISMGGLVVGEDYLVQLWTPFWNANWTTAFSSGGANTSGLLNHGLSEAFPSQYVIGTFTADAATQAILASGPSYAIPTALQLRSTSMEAEAAAVPEPASLLLFGTAIAGLAGARLRAARHTRRSAPSASTAT
jgi:hypothetical protein